MCSSQLQRDVLAEIIPEVPQIVVQEVPVPAPLLEEESTVHPQEPEMTVVPLVEETASPERLIFFM